MRSHSSRFLALFAIAILAPAVPADDWPQWMGPHRDGVWAETGLLDQFPKGGPKKLWSVPVGGGYAGPAVAGDKVYVTDRQLTKGAKNPDNPFDAKTSVAGVERVLCLDATTGAQVWKHEYPCAYQISYGVGPRCTPTVSGGKVYTLGAMGNLLCFDADKGDVLWRKDFKSDYHAKTPVWGFAGHPLVYQSLLVCLVGGNDALVVAFNKDTGDEVWKALRPAEPGAAGYSSPQVISVGGQDQLIQFYPTGVSGLDPKTGKPLWSLKLDQPTRDNMSIMTPQAEGGYLFVGGRTNAALGAKLDPAKPTAAWRGDGKTNGLYPINVTPLIRGGVIYGVDQNGALRGMELKTGKRLWYSFKPVAGADEEESFQGAGTGTAFLVRNGERYFLFNEKGDLILARLTPKGYAEQGRTHLIDPTETVFGRKVVWSHPAFARKCVFARNDKVIACFSLAKE